MPKADKTELLGIQVQNVNQSHLFHQALEDGLPVQQTGNLMKGLEYVAKDTNSEAQDQDHHHSLDLPRGGQMQQG